ncbi:unnamed protein product [Thlaspi arvense]|uniref:WIYLD domain-containing protein n=1 Tax=Thlaspi arvense TaxID=13288 RepID=A0AAU9S9E7_THLAR|nr:unnamed protein product [Thlaspi arvense]
MAPRGRRKKAGLMREDAARDAMRGFGFEERLIKVCIKEMLEVYGEEGWCLIEEYSYQVLLDKCLEKQEELTKKPEEKQKQEMALVQNEEMAEEQHEQTAQGEEKEQQVEDRRTHVGSNSTSLVVCGAETGAQADALSITSKAVITDSSPAAIESGEASMDYASPTVIQSGDASGYYAQHSVGGSRTSQCGWLSEEEDETDTNEGSDCDDGEIVHLTPEPLCEELEELLREVRGGKKRKRPTRWDK